MKKIKNESLPILAEAMTPAQYRRFKRLYEGKLSNITRNVRRSINKAFDDADAVENPSYLSDDDVEELTQEFIDKCHQMKDRAGRAIKRGGDMLKKGYKRTRDYWNRNIDKALEAPNPGYVEDEDDEDTLF